MCGTARRGEPFPVSGISAPMGLNVLVRVRRRSKTVPPKELVRHFLRSDSARLQEDEQMIEEIRGLTDQGVAPACHGGDRRFYPFLSHFLSDALDSRGEKTGRIARLEIGAAALGEH